MVDATQAKCCGSVRGRGGRSRLYLTLWFAGVVALLLCAAPAVADAPLPASTYDTGGQLHNDFCATPIGSTLDLRYLSGVPTGFYLPNTLTFDDGSCDTGQIRLDLHEKLSSQEGPLVFHRGGTGYTEADNVRYGQVMVSDLESVPDSAVKPSGDNRGAACPLMDTRDSYKVSVQPIPQPMK